MTLDHPHIHAFRVATATMEHHRAEVERLAAVRLHALEALVAEGKSLRQIAALVGVSGPRVHHILHPPAEARRQKSIR